MIAVVSVSTLLLLKVQFTRVKHREGAWRHGYCLYTGPSTQYSGCLSWKLRRTSWFAQQRTASFLAATECTCGGFVSTQEQATTWSPSLPPSLAYNSTLTIEGKFYWWRRKFGFDFFAHFCGTRVWWLPCMEDDLSRYFGSFRAIARSLRKGRYPEHYLPWSFFAPCKLQCSVIFRQVWAPSDQTNLGNLAGHARSTCVADNDTHHFTCRWYQPSCSLKLGGGTVLWPLSYMLHCWKKYLHNFASLSLAPIQTGQTCCFLAVTVSQFWVTWMWLILTRRHAVNCLLVCFFCSFLDLWLDEKSLPWLLKVVNFLE